MGGRLGLMLGVALLLAACGPKAPPPPTAEQARALAPADGRLAALYETSCKSCHATPGSGAPLVHDVAAWNGRFNQGMPVLVGHVVQGYKGMPAGGQCVACTAKDFEALIKFMAAKESVQ